MKNFEKRTPDDDGRADRIGEIEEPLPLLTVEKALNEIGVFSNLDHDLFLFLLSAFGETYLRADVAESDV